MLASEFTFKNNPILWSGDSFEVDEPISQIEATRPFIVPLDNRGEVFRIPTRSQWT